MSTFPVKFQLSSLLREPNGIEGQGFIDALKAIEKAGNWPVGMEPKEKVYVSVVAGLAHIRHHTNIEVAKKQFQTPFTPKPEDLTPQALDLSVEAIPVAPQNQYIRCAFDPECLYVVLGDPGTDEMLSAVNFHRAKDLQEMTYLYLEQMPDTARIVLESKQPS